MLKKNQELIISSNSPFSEDKLDREIIAINLTKVIQSTTQPFVISIEAPWGCGKTTFINMWKAFLEKEGHPCLYFNAWETDFSSDPLIAFIGEMDDYINKLELSTEDNKKISELWKNIKSVGGGVLKRTLPLVIQLATQGLVSAASIKGLAEAADDISEFAAELTEEKIKQYNQEKEGIKFFKENLDKLTQLITKEPEVKSPLVFFIDELDRCRPDYSISLLERIKHLFNVEGVIFILAIDRSQISESIKAIYGRGMDSDGYLRRFIDINFALPTPEANNYTRYLLFDYYKINSIINSEIAINNLDSCIFICNSIFNLSLRAQEQCCSEINLIIRTISDNDTKYSYLIVFLVFLKAYNKSAYDKLRQTSIDIEPALDILHSINFDNNKAIHFGSNKIWWTKNMLVRNLIQLLPKELITEKISFYKKIKNGENYEDKDIKNIDNYKYLENIIDRIENLQFSESKSTLLRILSLIDFYSTHQK